MARLLLLFCLLGGLLLRLQRDCDLCIRRGACKKFGLTGDGMFGKRGTLQQFPLLLLSTVLDDSEEEKVKQRQGVGVMRVRAMCCRWEMITMKQEDDHKSNKASRKTLKREGNDTKTGKPKLE